MIPNGTTEIINVLTFPVSFVDISAAHLPAMGHYAVKTTTLIRTLLGDPHIIG